MPWPCAGGHGRRLEIVEGAAVGDGRALPITARPGQPT